jgi:hypothetical protein
MRRQRGILYRVPSNPTEEQLSARPWLPNMPRQFHTYRPLSIGRAIRIKRSMDIRPPVRIRNQSCILSKQLCVLTYILHDN